MHKTRRRRNDIIARSLIYLLMTTVVIFLALVCLFIVLGYSINQKTGSPQQGGLIQFRSFPDGATVRVDGQSQSFTTPNKATTEAAAHSVDMNKKDYRAWNKSFTLKRGELLWLNARLVPNLITTDEAKQFDTLAQTVASPDKKWIAALEKPNLAELKIIDVRDEKRPKSVSLKIPAGIMKPLAPTDTFEITEWDFGSRYLLAKHVSGATTEWLRIDRSDETNAKNLTSEFKLDLAQLHFRGTNGTNFYGMSGGELRKLQLGQTPLPAIAQNVSEFNLYGGNKLGFITLKNNQQLVQVYEDGGEAPAVVETLPAQPAAHITLTSFFGDGYAAVSQGSEARLIKRPFDAKPRVAAKLHVTPDITWLYFSPNGQFLIAQNGQAVTSYNLERDQATSFTIPGTGPYTRSGPLQWLDDFYFWSDMGGTLRMFEFDGSNPEVINNVTPGQNVSLSDNGKRLFSIGTNTTTKKPVLQSSVMVIE